MSHFEASTTAGPAYARPISTMLERIDSTLEAVGNAFPLSAEPDSGVWQTSPDGRWTGGFWVGLLWLAHHATGLPKYQLAAQAALRRLEARLQIDNVLNGLVFHYGAVVGALLGAGAPAQAMAHAAARGLASRFNRAAGFIPLGAQSGSLTGDPSGETNIDGVPGMSLLFWAASTGADASLHAIARSHVLRHVDLCQRIDGSLHQAALVDARTGTVLKQFSPRGFANEGAWARAQSWGLLGFVQAYAWTSDELFLSAAVRLADWWLEHLPADGVAYWDFADPAIPGTFRDTSATAMAACGLLKLAAFAPSPEHRLRYLSSARASVNALVHGYLTPTSASDHRPPGMLVEGCWQRNEGMATRHELVWGDYFLFETLLTLSGRLEKIF